MQLVVEHRSDGLLERAVKEECPDDLKGTFIDQITWPVHRAAHQFLEEQVVGKTFVDEAELQSVLDTWPQFVEGRVNHLSKDFAYLWIRDGRVVSFPDRSPGGGLQIALIQAA